MSKDLRQIIETLSALEKKATPRPWRASGGYVWYDGKVDYTGNPRVESITTGHDQTMTQEDSALIVAMRNALPELLKAASRTEDGWIPVEQEPPLPVEQANSEIYLIHSPKHPGQIMGRYRRYNKTWTFWGSNSDFTSAITHWQPLPAPPNAENVRTEVRTYEQGVEQGIRDAANWCAESDGWDMQPKNYYAGILALLPASEGSTK